MINCRGSQSGNRNRSTVISMSLGGTSRNTARQNAINDAARAGHFITAAAGNSAADSRNFFPASYNNVISVGASDSADR